jgi:type I restriction enzyme S subunit
MSLPRYPEYKDSGTPWLGELPEHWKIKPVWTLFRRSKRIGFESEQLLSVYRDHGVIPKASRDDNNNKASDDLSVYQLVMPGDLAINKMKAWQGSVAISEHQGIVSPAYFIYEATHQEDSRYLHYLLRSPRYITGYLSISKGIRINQWDLEPQYHSRMPVILPPKVEQTAIATFLDRETAKIDELIAEQEKLIALLAEKRQATISHAVTKGLNPDAPMKDSGVAWLGEVPAHWAVKPLRYCIDYQEGPGIMAADFVESGVPLLRVSGVQGRWATLDGCNFLTPERVAHKWEHFRVKEGDLLISASASMGTVCEVGADTIGSIPYTGLIRLSGKTGVMIKPFVRSLVVSDLFITQIDLLKAGATIQHFGPTHLSQMTVPRPPVDEQIEIAAYIENQTIRLDTLTAEATRGIALLKERRSALISAAVTGKIDVRHLAEQEAA